MYKINLGCLPVIIHWYANEHELAQTGLSRYFFRSRVDGTELFSLNRNENRSGKSFGSTLCLEPILSGNLKLSLLRIMLTVKFLQVFLNESWRHCAVKE